MEELIHTAAGTLKSKDQYAVGQKFAYVNDGLINPRYKIRITERSQERHNTYGDEWRSTRQFAEYIGPNNEFWALGWFYKRNLRPVDEWKN